MLARNQRLTTTQFARTFAGGTILRHALLQARVHRRGDENKTLRAAFVAPRKMGGAVVRNRVRRRLGEAYRAVVSTRSPDTLASCDLIFIATPAVDRATAAQLVEAIDQLLRRAGRKMKENGG